MDTILCCCVFLGLLGEGEFCECLQFLILPFPEGVSNPSLHSHFAISTGYIAPGIKQTPRHKITEMGQTVTLKCDPISGHQYIYWCRQTAPKGIEFMVYLFDKASMDKGDFFKDRFSAEKPE